MKSLPAAALILSAVLSAARPAAAAERAIDAEITVPAGVDAVWQAWTTRDGVRGFFAPDAHVEARVGGPFQIYMDPGAEPGHRGADDMRFLALQPPRMLSFDWNAPPHLAAVRQQRTVVIVRLHPQGSQSTRVTLHHTGWGDGDEWDRAFQYFDKAWPAVLGNLKLRFETGPKDWSPWLAQLAEWRAQQAAKAAADAAAKAAAGTK